LDTIFLLFVLKNIVLPSKKLYLSYLSIKLLGFYINRFSLSIIKERIKIFRILTFLNNLRVLE
ncbi:hypothetical protein QR685DRAFT_434795, partial [Neurospora intermedia]